LHSSREKLIGLSWGRGSIISEQTGEIDDGVIYLGGPEVHNAADPQCSLGIGEKHMFRSQVALTYLQWPFQSYPVHQPLPYGFCMFTQYPFGVAENGFPQRVAAK
jgi:hypothetical protein